MSLWDEGPPLSPVELGDAIGASDRYVRKAIAAGALVALRLPNLGKSGKPKLGRLRIARPAARAFAESFGLKAPQSEQSEPLQTGAGAESR